MVVLRKEAISGSAKAKFSKQLLINFETETKEKSSNLRLAEKSVAYKKTLVYCLKKSFPPTLHKNSYGMKVLSFLCLVFSLSPPDCYIAAINAEGKTKIPADPSLT